ncbi:MAG: hypothetical protein JST09_03040 [Bacteroidetes bacterium]|nr:hypothetical protein [Bacteroidota bacterium]
MKLLLSTSFLVLLISILSLQGGLSSCTKDHTIYDTVTVTRTDTLVIKDTILTTDILTSHSWKLLEVRGVVGGSVIYYLRGGSSNTESFDNAYITFNSDNTGLLVDNSSTPHIITNWTLSTTDHTKLIYTAYNNGAIQSTYTWDNIRYKNGYIYYDHYFHDNLTGYDAHSQEIQAPK